MKFRIGSIALFILLFVSGSLLSAQSVSVAATSGKGIHFFEGSFEELKARALAENKLIFFDAYASWCGPCKRMINETFADEKVGEFYNQHFINYKLDMEKGEGPILKTAYNVSSYPSLFYLTPDGKVIYSIKGYQPPLDFIEEGQKVCFTKEELARLKERYDSGDHAVSLLRDYVRYLLIAGVSDKGVFEEYVKGMPVDITAHPDEMDMVYLGIADLSAPFYAIYLKNKDAFTHRYSDKAMQIRVEKSCVVSMNQAIATKDRNKFIPAMEVYKTLSWVKEKSNRVILFNHDFYQATEDWEEYMKLGREYLTSAQPRDKNLLRLFTINFLNHATAKEDLFLVKKSIEQALEMRNDYDNNLMLAQIHFRLGDKEEAIKIADRAIAIGKVYNKDVSAAEKLKSSIP